MTDKTEGTPRTDFVAHKSGDAEWNRSINRFGRMMAHAQILEREAAELRDQLTSERRRVIDECANIALAIDSGRGNEKEIAKAILALSESQHVNKNTFHDVAEFYRDDEPQQSALEDKSGGWISVPKVAGWYWISDSDGWRIVEVFKRPGHDYLAIAAPQTGMGKRDFDPVAKMPDAKWNGPLPIPPLPKGE